MNKQKIIINGDNFSDLESFYDEIDRVLTKDLDWQTGHNLDAFNDLLRGGFGVGARQIAFFYSSILGLVEAYCL